MGVATHLGIRLRDYDARIRAFIPRYDEMLDTAAAALRAVRRPPRLAIDLGVGTGALAARCLAAAPGMQVLGVDADPEALAVAEKRLPLRFTGARGDFRVMPLPRCDAVTASLSLHHVLTRRAKTALYERCHAALRPGGGLISADLFLASAPGLVRQNESIWLAHLQHQYARSEALRLMRAWAKDDRYFPLDQELAMLQSSGFRVDVVWRHGGFAVLLGIKSRGKARRHGNPGAVA